jgi:multidrug efflux system membrane fusion protein
MRSTFDNPKGVLFPNQFVNVRLLVDTMSGVTLAPNAAIQLGASGDFVYLLKDDSTVAKRDIAIGPADGKHTVITSGLAAGDKVVIDGVDRLRDGAKVKVVDHAPAGNGQAGTGAGPGSGGEGSAAGSTNGGGQRHKRRHDQAGAAEDSPPPAAATNPAPAADASSQGAAPGGASSTAPAPASPTTQGAAPSGGPAQQGASTPSTPPAGAPAQGSAQ